MTQSLKPLLSLLCLLCVVLGGTACRQGELISSVSSVTPQEVLGFDDELLTLSGHFYAQLTLDPSQAEGELNATFTGSMQWTEVPGQPLSPPSNPVVPLVVQYIDATTLQARTSGLLEPGFYALELSDPRGNPVEVPTDLLVKVSQVRPDHAVLSIPSRYVSVGEVVQVRAGVVKTDGSASYANHPLTVIIKGPSLKLDGVSMSAPNVTQSSDSEGITTITVAGTVTEAVPEAFISFIPGRESTLSIATKTEGLLHTYPDEETSLVVFPEPLTRLGVYFPELEEAVPGCEAGAPSSSEAEEPLQLSAGVPVQVKVLALDNSCNVLDVTDNLELLDAASGEEAPIYLGAIFPPYLSEGVWTGYVQYEDLVSSRLLAVGPQGTYGTSTSFDVQPGPPRRLVVELEEAGNDAVVTAGELFSVTVWQNDGLEHDVAITEPSLLELTNKTGTLACEPPEIRGAYAYFPTCRITGSNPRDAITATMQYESPLSGSSSNFEVMAGPPIRVSVEPPAPSPVAGTGFSVLIQLLDEFGNLCTEGTDGVAVNAQLTLGGDPVGVESALTLLEGSAQLDTFAEQAASGYVVMAYVPALGIEGQSAPFEILPSSTAALLIQPCPTPAACPWQAGVSGLVSVRAVDRYGNLTPSFAQPLSLSSNLESTTFSAASSQWSEGSLSLTVTLTRAGTGAVLTAVAGEQEGSSLPFEITPGPVQFVRWVNQPYVAWLGEPNVVEVQAQDAFGNLAVTEGGELRVSSSIAISTEASSEAPAKSITVAFTAGRWQAALYFATLGESNTLVARYLSMSASTASFPVYTRDCESASTLSVTANNQPEVAVACLVSRPSSSPSARIEFVATTTGTVADVVWDFGDGTGQAGKTLQRVTHDYWTAGRFHMRAYVVDPALCATATSLRVYTNEDNDMPVGPLTVAPTASTLLASGDSTSAETTVTVTAYDCQGDPASGTSFLTIQPELGAVSTPDADERSPGVQVKLDSRAGTTSFSYSVEEERFGGVARLVVAAVSGLADGEGQVTVLNDVVSPVVLETWPQGFLAEDVQELLVRFSEPLRGGAALQSPVIQVYSQRLGSQTVLARELEQDGTLLRLKLSEPLVLSDAEEELITVTLPSSRAGASITDLDGNRLDGNYSGVAEDEGDPFVFQFGNRLRNAAVLKVAHCEPSTYQFSPDGQDGLGNEADLLAFDAAVEASVTFQTLGIRLIDSATGEAVAWIFWPMNLPELVFTHRVVWDGTDLTGRVLPNGHYEPELLGLLPDQPPVTLSCLDEGETVLLLNPLDAGGLP